MTDVRQFGDRATRSFDCGRCEAMLADAADDMLSPEQQQFFDAHIVDCGPCAQLLAEARRGAAWLEMLRTPAPEPPAALLEKILVQTSGAALLPVPLNQPAPAMAHGYSNVLPFPRRAVAAMRSGAFARMVFEPRLAMTAAMAFLSIALTLDLMGVNPLNLRVADLTPSGVERAYSDAHARFVQYYEGLRVVYELESRLHDFENVQQNARDASTPAPSQQQPAAQPAGDDQQTQPAGDDQSAPDQNSAPQSAPAQKQQPDGKSSVEPKTGPNTRVGERQEGRAKGTLTVFTPKANASRPAISDAALDDETEDYLGPSSAVGARPLHERAARRAA